VTSPGPFTLLLVDDDGVDREALRRALLRVDEPLRVLQAETAAEALEIIGREPVDCALVDFHLPDRDGTSLIRDLRERAPACAIVAVTGQNDLQTAAELVKAGAAEYLPKSALSPDRLGAALRSALRVSRAELTLREKDEALRQAEERFRLALAGSGVIVFEQDRTLRYTFLHNPGGELQDADVAARTDEELFGPVAAARLNELKQRALRGEWVREDVEVNGRCFHLIAQPRRNAAGEITGILGTAQDITARKRASEFEQQLVGIVSHDLRNPIGAILMSAGVLLRRAETDDTTRRAAERISAVAQRTARLIHDLLDFTQARIGKGIPVQRRPMDLREVAQQVVDELATLHAARELRLLAEGDCTGSWDADRVAQVLSNLLTNALVYSPPGTPVTLTLTGRADQVSFEVHNLGEPLAQERMSELFEPFERGHSRDGRGIGLGLYIVRALVQSHGGTVEGHSSADAGTRFVVRLPREETLRAAG
jgi:sigma-B regulation protein RsbU (phosphoserine phosphatase)